MSDEPESVMLQLLRGTRAEMADMRNGMADMRSQMATKSDVADLRSEMHSFRADVASDFLTTREEFNEEIAGLRRAVIEYHTSTIGHGILISELEARLRRVEQRIDIDPPEAH